ncbi:MAG: choice-of-anchor D domain-containing protein, partial [Alphaproteobacteria bacterium]|nr:choice-of-anchor D domain-containing protein [Alphaproteobacteria bacterium]
MTFLRSVRIAVVLCLVALAAGNAEARDAAFIDPGSMGNGEEAIKVDPKPDIDMGETALNVAKRTSVFFVNQTNVPVKLEKITVNGDSNVTAEITANDCMKQGTIAAGNRCSVEISVTPTSPGTWSVDVQLTHNGAGRLTRAHVTGKTSGSGANDHKETGLSVSSRDIKPVDFGDVDIGSGKIVRSTLMVNDSAEAITLYAIDVIEADNGLQRLDQGCAVDMELAPGASCPVTLLWVPTQAGPISTDLIIRHSGRLGFAVIPIRGVAKDPNAAKIDLNAKG